MADEPKGIEKALEGIRKSLRDGEQAKVIITIKPEKPNKAGSSEK